MSKLWAWQVEAERVAMESVLGAMRSALGMKVASCLARDDRAGVRALIGTNPMKNLAEPPKNYLGVRDNRADIAGGNWYFDIDAKALVYRVRHAERFIGSNAEARFRIEAVTEGGHGAGVIQGVRLAAVEPYRWLHAGEDERSAQ